MDIFTVGDLENLRTLEQGHTQDLKIDTGHFRVWLDRTGEDSPVQYEVLVDGRWYDMYVNEDAELVVVLNR